MFPVAWDPYGLETLRMQLPDQGCHLGPESGGLRAPDSASPGNRLESALHVDVIDSQHNPHRLDEHEKSQTKQHCKELSEAWSEIGKQQLADIDRIIEHAMVNGRVCGRSKYLLVRSLGPSLDLEFQLKWSAVKCLARLGHDAVLPPTVPKALAYFGWKSVAGGVITQRGYFEFGSDSTTALWHIAVQAWARLLWRCDATLRTVNATGQEPVLSSHIALWDSPHAGSGINSQHRALLAQPWTGPQLCHWRKLQSVQCSCGRPDPDAQHLTYLCTASDGPPPPPDPALARLALWLIPPASAPVPRSMRTPDTVTTLAEQLRGRTYLLLATDGGALKGPLEFELSSWSIACVDLTSGCAPAASAGLINGCDSTPVPTQVASERTSC